MVVGHYEGEDWILHEVIEGPASQLVQLHQILKVGDLSLLPAGGAGGTEEGKYKLRENEINLYNYYSVMSTIIFIH